MDLNYLVRTYLEYEKYPISNSSIFAKVLVISSKANMATLTHHQIHHHSGRTFVANGMHAQNDWLSKDCGV